MSYKVLGKKRFFLELIKLKLCYTEYDNVHTRIYIKKVTYSNLRSQ